MLTPLLSWAKQPEFGENLFNLLSVKIGLSTNGDKIKTSPYPYFFPGQVLNSWLFYLPHQVSQKVWEMRDSCQSITVPLCYSFFSVLQYGSSMGCSYFKAYPPTWSWGLLHVIWSIVVSSTNCKGIFDLVSGTPPHLPSSLAIVFTDLPISQVFPHSSLTM